MNSAEVIELAQNAHVQLVRFLYCDHSGVTRAKQIHVAHLAHKLREGLGLTRAQMAMNLLEQLIDIEGMEPVGEIRMVPDPETFSILPWAPASASLICDQLDHNHQNWGACPRSFLKDMLTRAGHMGIKVEATFENEYYLAREVDGAYIPFDHAPVYSAIGLDLSAQVMHDIVKALSEQGLIVEQAINEYGPGTARNLHTPQRGRARRRQPDQAARHRARRGVTARPAGQLRAQTLRARDRQRQPRPLQPLGY